MTAADCLRCRYATLFGETCPGHDLAEPPADVAARTAARMADKRCIEHGLVNCPAAADPAPLPPWPDEPPTPCPTCGGCMGDGDRVTHGRCALCWATGRRHR